MRYINLRLTYLLTYKAARTLLAVNTVNAISLTGDWSWEADKVSYPVSDIDFPKFLFAVCINFVHMLLWYNSLPFFGCLTVLLLSNLELAESRSLKKNIIFFGTRDLAINRR